jgi:hypothetical protein
MTLPTFGLMNAARLAPDVAMTSMATKNTVPALAWRREPLASSIDAAPDASASSPIEMWIVRSRRCVVVIGNAPPPRGEGA